MVPSFRTQYRGYTSQFSIGSKPSRCIYSMLDRAYGRRDANALAAKNQTKKVLPMSMRFLAARRDSRPMACACIMS